MGVLTNYYENKDLSNVTSLDRIFEEEPVGLDVFIKDSKFLGMDGDGLSPIQMEFVQYSERVYKRDMYPLLAEEFGGYWAETKDVRMTNLISAEWGKGSSDPNTPIYDAQTGLWRPLKDFSGGPVGSAYYEDGKVLVKHGTRSFKEGEGRMFVVKTKRGRTMRVWEGHRYLAREKTKSGSKGQRFYREGKATWRRLWDMNVGDHLAVSSLVPEPLTCATFNDRDVELVGLLLGDGYSSGGHTAMMTVGRNSPVTYRRVLEVFGTFPDTEPVVKADDSGGSFRYHIKPKNDGTNRRSDALYSFVREWGLHGHGAYTKRVPEQLFRASNRQIALLVSRLTDTDGWVSASNTAEWGYATASEGLADDIVNLLLRLGVSANKQIKKVKYNGEVRDYFQVRVRNRGGLLRLLPQLTLLDKEEEKNRILEELESKPVTKTRAQHGDLEWDTIESIEYDGWGEYWTLSVDGPAAYISNGGVFDHNSGKDMCSRIISLRIAYLLMCLRSPQEYFGMPGSDSIHMLNIAANAPQAQRAFFEPMTRAVKTGWFADKAEPKKSSIAYAKNLEAISGHSSVDGQEGLNLILGVADEIDAFKTRTEMVGLGRRSREASTSAESILDMLKTSASAQPLYSKVLTPTGWKSMGDLKVGDRVVDPKGDTRSRVTGIYPQGKTPVYELTFADGTSTRASHHHLWEIEYLWSPTTVKERAQRGSETVTAVVTTEWLVENLPKFQRWGRAIRVVEGNLDKEDFESESVIDIHPYLLGALLGDGGLTHYTPTITSADQEMFDTLEPLLPEGVKFSDNVSQHEGCQSRRLVHGKGKLNPLTEALKALGVWGKYSYDKSVPEAYKWRSAKDRLALLQGLLDTDGSADRKTGIATFSSTSKQLAEDVAQLARSLSLGARIIGPRSNAKSAQSHIQSRRPYYTVTINKYKDVELFRLRRKLSRTDTVKTRRFAHAIVSVERLEDDITQCIKVSADSELYYTDDFIVTHNTRFPEVYKQVTISFPRYKNSKIQQLTAQGKESNAKYGRDSNYYVSGPHATWVVNPLRKQEDFKMDYLQNPVEAAAKYECKPAESSNPYFRDVVPFVEAEDRDEEPITVNYELVNSISEVNGNDVQQWEAVFTFADWFKPVPGALYAMHGDLAVNGDRAGVAMSHVVDWVEKEVTFINDNHLIETSKESLPVVRNDFTIGFEADIGSQPAREIQIRWARQLAYALIQRGFTVALFTFDGFQSVDSMQLLEASGIETDRVSTDLNNNVWRTLRDVASDRRLKRPKNELLLTELKSLVDLGRKVDHPPNGGKDLADAFACSIVGAITLGGSESEDHEDIQVGGSIFETQNQMGGLARPEEFGISLGSMLPIGMTLEAPFGTN